jgi:hypothetical protein
VERGHATYLKWRADIARQPDGWIAGRSVVGEKPSRSPGDTSGLGLPPTGEQLLEAERPDASRSRKFGAEMTREFGDADDGLKDLADTVHNFLQQPPPPQSREVSVPVTHAAPEAPQHGQVSVGSTVELGLVLGVIGWRAASVVHDRLRERREDVDGNH